MISKKLILVSDLLLVVSLLFLAVSLFAGFALPVIGALAASVGGRRINNRYARRKEAAQ